MRVESYSWWSKVAGNFPVRLDKQGRENSTRLKARIIGSPLWNDEHSVQSCHDQVATRCHAHMWLLSLCELASERKAWQESPVCVQNKHSLFTQRKNSVPVSIHSNTCQFAFIEAGQAPSETPTKIPGFVYHNYFVCELKVYVGFIAASNIDPVVFVDINALRVKKVSHYRVFVEGLQQSKLTNSPTQCAISWEHFYLEVISIGN